MTTYRIRQLKWKKGLYGTYSGHVHPNGPAMRRVAKSMLKKPQGYWHGDTCYGTLLEAIAAAQKSFEEYISHTYLEEVE